MGKSYFAHIMNRKIELIDFLKGFSIFTIVVYHLLYKLPQLSAIKNALLMGGTGVHTFILISGFGLYLSYLRKKLSFFDFIKKRFTKIYLPYIFIVTISALIALCIPIYKNSLYAYLGHVFLYKMFDGNIITSYGYQLWFISTIIQFYLIFNLLAYLKGKLSPRAFFMVGIFTYFLWVMIVWLLGKENYGNWNRSCFQFLWEFMLGMVLAELYARRGELWKIKQIYLLLISVAGFVLYGLMALKMGSIGKLLNDIPAMFGYTTLAIFIYQLGIKAVNKFFVFTGVISYSLYLTHVLIQVIILYILKIAGVQVSLAAAALMLILSYFVSYLFNKLISKYI